METEMKPWEPNIEDATALANQASNAVQKLTQLLEEKGVLTRAEADDVFSAFRPET